MKKYKPFIDLLASLFTIVVLLMDIFLNMDSVNYRSSGAACEPVDRWLVSTVYLAPEGSCNGQL